MAHQHFLPPSFSSSFHASCCPVTLPPAFLSFYNFIRLFFSVIKHGIMADVLATEYEIYRHVSLVSQFTMHLLFTLWHRREIAWQIANVLRCVCKANKEANWKWKFFYFCFALTLPSCIYPRRRHHSPPCWWLVAGKRHSIDRKIVNRKIEINLRGKFLCYVPNICECECECGWQINAENTFWRDTYDIREADPILLSSTCTPHSHMFRVLQPCRDTRSRFYIYLFFFRIFESSRAKLIRCYRQQSVL